MAKIGSAAGVIAWLESCTKLQDCVERMKGFIKCMKGHEGGVIVHCLYVCCQEKVLSHLVQMDQWCGLKAIMLNVYCGCNYQCLFDTVQVDNTLK